jgi:hypothetical protein
MVNGIIDKDFKKKIMDENMQSANIMAQNIHKSTSMRPI